MAKRVHRSEVFFVLEPEWIQDHSAAKLIQTMQKD